VKYHEYYTLRVAQSKNNVPIRLTYKQWAHVVDSHDYMAGNMDMVMESVEKSKQDTILGRGILWEK
jgi:hypothetical protein